MQTDSPQNQSPAHQPVIESKTFLCKLPNHGPDGRWRMVLENNTEKMIRELGLDPARLDHAKIINLLSASHFSEALRQMIVCGVVVLVERSNGADEIINCAQITSVKEKTD